MYLLGPIIEETKIQFLLMRSIRSQFNKKPWTKPRVEGVNLYLVSLRINILKLLMTERFVELHEQAHTECAPVRGESTATYENRMNDIAMAEMRDRKLFGADTTPATPATANTQKLIKLVSLPMLLRKVLLLLKITLKFKKK